jgi:hypothetical protein
VFREEKDPIVSLAVPIGVELYLASMDPRLADLIYQAHKSWGTVEMYVDLYTDWLKSIWSEHFHERIEDEDFKAGMVAMIGATGNLCGMYAHGLSKDYRDILEGLLQAVSMMTQMPAFALKSTVERIASIVEGGDIRIMGRRVADLKESLCSAPEP